MPPRAARGETTMHRILQPAGWKRPVGYANGMTARGRMVFVSAQVGWAGEQRFASEDFIDQVGQALRNVVAVLEEGDARPEHIARMTWYILDRDEFNTRLAEIGPVYREILGPVFPAMSVVQVGALLDPVAK